MSAWFLKTNLRNTQEKGQGPACMQNKCGRVCQLLPNVPSSLTSRETEATASAEHGSGCENRGFLFSVPCSKMQARVHVSVNGMSVGVVGADCA